MQQPYWSLWEETRQRQADRLEAAARARLGREIASSSAPRRPLAIRTAGLLRHLADQLESRHPLSA